VRGLSIEGALPAGPGRLRLSPERGLSGAITALGEIEVHDPVVDDAWVIRGDGPALLLALMPALAPLAADAPEIAVEETSVRIRYGRPVASTALAERVHAALALWERAASFRLAAV
jgi:hypothetical protein